MMSTGKTLQPRPLRKKMRWVREYLSDSFWQTIYDESDDSRAMKLELKIRALEKEFEQKRQENCKLQAATAECAREVREMTKDIAALKKEAGAA